MANQKSASMRQDPAEVRKKEAQVLAAAKRIGIDLHTEQHLWWIAEFAANAELPAEWREFQTEDGETAYYHPGTKCLSKTHPVLDKFETFIQKQRDFAQHQDPIVARMSTDQLAGKLGIVLDGIMNRYNKGLPPVTPEIVESVALYFCVPTEREWNLTLQIRMALEAYVDCQYELTTVTKDLIDPMTFLLNMRKEIITRCVLQKEDPILMCQECEERSAKFKCEQCKDFFCSDCFALTHATGKRKNHKTQSVEQETCDLCDKVRAIIISLENKQRFCDNCYHKKKRDLLGHRMKVIKGLPCSECGADFDAQDINDTGLSSNDDPDTDAKFGCKKIRKRQPASILCEDCSDLFCHECFIELHRRGKRLQHVSLQINSEGQLIHKGEILPPEEGQEKIKRARLTAEGGAFVSFRDDQMNTYWYHLRDKVVTHQNPYM